VPQWFSKLESDWLLRSRDIALALDTQHITELYTLWIIYSLFAARNFSLEKAEEMLRNHMKFRREIGADTILEDWTPPEVSEGAILLSKPS